MKLLDAPDNVECLLESNGYVLWPPEEDNRPRGHVLYATKRSDGTSLVVKCTRKGDSESRMMTYFYYLRRQGTNLPITDIMDIIEDAKSNTVLLVLKHWGRSLAELGRLSPPDFFHILRQCFEAVSVLHAMGIAHLDISCYNFLCNSKKQVAIIDFEASRYFNESETVRSKCHPQLNSHSIYPCRTTEIPPEFRAEDAYQRRHCAYKLDIFALGVLVLRFAKSSGFDCPRLVLLAEPLVACDPMRRPTAGEALIWFHKWCERVGVVLPGCGLD
ncbi:MAP kinase kinase kinase, partial [Rhizoctonia solani]